MHPALLVGAGFLLGTAGVKAVTSQPAKKLYVKGVVGGMKVRDSVNSVVDEAKAEFDDIVAEAEYTHAGQAEADEPETDAAATSAEDGQ